MSARPFQVGDRVRITGWGTRGPIEITIDEIDPADPCGRFGPYISGNGPDGHGTCAMNDDVTGTQSDDRHTVELLEPAEDDTSTEDATDPVGALTGEIGFARGVL